MNMKWNQIYAAILVIIIIGGTITRMFVTCSREKKIQNCWGKHVLYTVLGTVKYIVRRMKI